MEIFTSICDAMNVPPETSSKWLANITRQYSAANRHFHNGEMLEKKLRLIEELAGEEAFRNALMLAALFQYYEYDVKRDLKRENCDQFRLFIDQAGIKDVSKCSPNFEVSCCVNILGVAESRCSLDAPGRSHAASGRLIISNRLLQ